MAPVQTIPKLELLPLTEPCLCHHISFATMLHGNTSTYSWQTCITHHNMRYAAPSVKSKVKNELKLLKMRDKNGLDGFIAMKAANALFD